MATIAIAELVRLLDDNLPYDQQRSILSFAKDIEILALPNKPKMILTGWIDKHHAPPKADKTYAVGEKFKVWTYASPRRDSYALIHSLVVHDGDRRPHQIGAMVNTFDREEYHGKYYVNSGYSFAIRKELPRTVMLKCWMVATGETLAQKMVEKSKEKIASDDDDAAASEGIDKGSVPTKSTKRSAKENLQEAKRQKKSNAWVDRDDDDDDSACGEPLAAKNAATDDNPPRNGNGKEPMSKQTEQAAAESDGSSEYNSDYDVWRGFITGRKQDSWERIGRAYGDLYGEEVPPTHVLKTGYKEIKKAYKTEHPIRLLTRTAAYRQWRGIESEFAPAASPGSPNDDDDGDASNERSDMDIWLAFMKGQENDNLERVRRAYTAVFDDEAPPTVVLSEGYAEIEKARGTDSEIRYFSDTLAFDRWVKTASAARPDHLKQVAQPPGSLTEDVDSPPRHPLQQVSDQFSPLFIGEEGEDAVEHIEVPPLPEDADFFTCAELVGQIESMDLPDDHPIFDRPDYQRTVNTVRARFGMSPVEDLYNFSMWDDFVDDSGRPFFG